MNVYWRIPSF